MSIEIKVPTVGESITEVTIASWVKNNGDFVEEDDILCEIESDKATVELPSTGSGTLKILVEDGETVPVGHVIAVLEESGQKAAPKKEEAPATPAPETSQQTPAASGGGLSSREHTPSPAAAKILNEKNVSPESVNGSGPGGRIIKEDALKAQAFATPTTKSTAPLTQTAAPSGSRGFERKKMTPLRKTIARKLVEAKNTTAMLTTFNEVDMSAVMKIRKKYKDAFKEKHEIGLGFMSFFTKAATMALKEFPLVNSMIEDQEIVTYDYVDMGIAVSTPKGLVVPNVRDADKLSLAQIEREIMNLAIKARDGKITLEDMSGGTFTITNGGVFGSMLSTPIINAPQSAILGMHNIVERPVAVNGEVVVRPVMYLALSYDHRIIDGRESVSFLKSIKERIEDPARMLLDV